MPPLKLRHKVLAVVGTAVSLGFIGSGLYYVRQQEESLLRQNEQTMVRLAESVSHGLQSVMLAGSADIAQAFAENLKKMAEVSDFRIMRSNGEEAFRDNATIDDVNRRRGEEIFEPRDTEERSRLLPEDDPNLRRVLQTQESLKIYRRGDTEKPTLTFMLPVLNGEACYKCHGSKNPVRGVVTLTTSLAPVERDILKIRQHTILILGGALMLTMLLTGYALGRAVIRPIERATRAMNAITGGNLEARMNSAASDEIGQLANSFNTMTHELKRTYASLQRERNKLTTIIQSSAEGIVVSDAMDRIVLVNPAACELMGRSQEAFFRDGFLALFESPEEVGQWLVSDGVAGPYLRDCNGRRLRLVISTIRHSDGQLLGSVAQIRDVTEELRLESELRVLSTTDGLTGLFNRRYLDENLRTELVRARRTKLPVSVMMFDIDHFKRFNDTYGHDQGDRVLKAVANLVRKEVRGTDIPCRYGGEEFLVILPATDASAARALAETLRIAIEAMVVDDLKVTVSIGVATVPDIDAADAEALVAAADAGLYAAKAQGRNRVCVGPAESGEKTA